MKSKTVDPQDLTDEEKLEIAHDALFQLNQWSNGYPKDIFTPPNYEKMHKVLQKNGMTIDGLSADIYRRTLKRVNEITAKALKDLK